MTSLAWPANGHDHRSLNTGPDTGAESMLQVTSTASAVFCGSPGTLTLRRKDISAVNE